jgi:hypothetical protein
MFGQLAQVWVKYMDAEPKVLILPPIETLLDALHGEFPADWRGFFRSATGDLVINHECGGRAKRS